MNFWNNSGRTSTPPAFVLGNYGAKCFGLEMTSPTMPDLIKKSTLGSPFYSDLKLIDQLFLKMIRMDPIYNSDAAETCVVINSI